ncbi:MAG: MMPL family transporter [Bacteroidota bacterium]
MTEQNQSKKAQKTQFGVRWGKAVISYRWPVFIGSFIFFMAYMGLSGGNIKFDSDYHVFFSEDNPQVLAYDKLQNTFTKDDNVFIVIERRDGKDVFDSETLKAIEDLTKAAWQTPHSSRVDAITNFQYTKAVGDDLYVDDLISDANQKTDSEIGKLKEIATTDSRIVHRLINEEGTATAVNVTVRLPDVDNGENAEITAFARELVKKFEEENPELQTYLSGFVMLNSAFFESAMGDMTTLTPLMFLFIIVTVFLTTRTITGTLATLLVIVLSIGMGMGFVSYTGIGLTPPSAAFMNIVLTLAVADSIHILVTFIQGMKKGLEKNEAIVESLRVNFMPVFITSLTTIIGFLSMNTSDSPPFHDLGNLTSVGMAAAFLFSVTLLPSILSIFPVRIKATSESGKVSWLDHQLENLSEFVIVRKRPVIAASSIFILAGSFLVFQNELNDEFIKYFSPKVDFRTDTDHISENLTGIYTMEYSIGSDGPGGVNDPDYLAKLKEFEKWLYTNPEVVHVNAFTDIMRHVNKSMHGDSLKYFSIPEEREHAAQFLFLYELSLPFGLDLNNQVNVDKSETRVIVTLENIPTKRMLKLGESASQWLEENTPDYMNAEAVSSTMMFAHLSERQILSMISGTAIALVLISLVLGFAIKSLKFGFISLIPNVTPVLVGLGMWGLLYGYINVGLSIVFGMTLGIIVDDTVHFISKYLRARREHGYSPEDSIRYAFSTVGKALVVTSFILVIGFLVLAQSNFRMNSDMAKITGMIITLALLLDFLFLPALLLLGSGSSASKDGKSVQLSNQSNIA